MNTIEKIKQDLKEALKNKEEKKVTVLRMTISAVRNKEIEMRKGEDVELSEEQVQQVVASEIKKRKDSVQAYEEANREDLVQNEKQEIEILEKYMPEQISDEDLEKIVLDVVEKSDDKNFGKIMGQVMGKVKGQADGNRVSAMVKKVMG